MVDNAVASGGLLFMDCERERVLVNNEGQPRFPNSAIGLAADFLVRLR